MNQVASTRAVRRVARDAPVEAIKAILAEDGAAIIEKFLTEDQVERLNAEADALLDAVPPSVHEDDGYKSYHPSSTKQLTCLVKHSKIFRDELLEHDVATSILDAVFLESAGDYWLSLSDFRILGPGTPAQPMHRDLENNPVFFNLGPKGDESVINFIVAMTDFTEANGATRVITGSNHWPDFKDRGSVEQTVAAEMKAGDAIVICGKTAHAGGTNTTDTPRRAVLWAVIPSYLTPKEAHAISVEPELARTFSPRIQKLIGYRSQYPACSPGKPSPGVWQVGFADISQYLKL